MKPCDLTKVKCFPCTPCKHTTHRARRDKGTYTVCASCGSPEAFLGKQLLEVRGNSELTQIIFFSAKFEICDKKKKNGFRLFETRMTDKSVQCPGNHWVHPPVDMHGNTQSPCSSDSLTRAGNSSIFGKGISKWSGKMTSLASSSYS